MTGFCLLVELHQEGSAKQACFFLIEKKTYNQAFFVDELEAYARAQIFVI